MISREEPTKTTKTKQDTGPSCQVMTLLLIQVLEPNPENIWRKQTMLSLFSGMVKNHLLAEGEKRIGGASAST